MDQETMALIAPDAPKAAVFLLTRYDAGMPRDGATYGHATQLILQTYTYAHTARI